MYPAFAQTLSFAIPVLTVLLAYLAGYSAARINRKNKIADVVMHCINRYDVISQDRAKITTRREAIHHFHRMYGLKSDQYDYWLTGLIDAENIASWFYSTLHAFQTHRAVTFIEDGREVSMTYEEGWEEVVSNMVAPNTSFVIVVEEMRELARKEMNSLDRYYALISLLGDIERAERPFTRFADVSFVFHRIRGGDMRAFLRMERHHYRNNQKYVRRKQKMAERMSGE